MSGRGTSGGVAFQGEVGACIAALLLTERPLSRIGTGILNIPGIPRKISFETGTSIDDIHVETNLGHIFIQAKRTVSLSNKADGELASVVQQFVRQFRAGIQENGLQRELNISCDRFLLAVGDEAPNTIALNLRQALERTRTGAATVLPERLTSALNIFSELISNTWLAETASPICENDKQAILSICDVIIIGESQKQLSIELLQNVVQGSGDESALYGLLVKWSVKSSESGVGGNVEVIRHALQIEIKLKEPPSFKEDVIRLNAYSRKVVQRLKRFTELNTPDGDITISRTVIKNVVAAAREKSLLITGEPGAGKSSVLYHVAEILSNEAKVVTLTVEGSSISLSALNQEIQITHSIEEVLKQMSSNEPAYLILDALDAVRGGLAEETYKKLVREAAALPSWRIIASVRTFDLRMGREWRTLFAGKAPFPDYSDKMFSNVCHLHVGLLDDQEDSDLAAKSPTLYSAINAAGPKVKLLTKNPFNLGLVSDLLNNGPSAEALALVKTRGQLLERYWEERITELGIPATVALKTIVSLMITSRSIDLPETEIPMDAAATIDTLQELGVLTTEQTHRIAFRHHVLFDYAVARLMLQPNQSIAIKLLSKDNGIGLLISPSLGYWLEELKNNIKAIEYWESVLSLIGNETTDPIIRVEAARLVVQGIAPTESLITLINLVKENNLIYNQALNQLVGTLVTNSNNKQTIEPGPWTEFVSEFIPTEEQVGNIRTLVGLLLDLPNSPEGLQALGKASRNLFDVMSTNERLIPWLSPHAVQYVGQTYKTDPVASRQRLETIFSEDRFKRFGHIEIPWLAQEALSFAGCDPDFTVKLFYRVFLGGDFSRDATTSISNSWILSLTSNAAQDFSMAAHSLSELYPKIIDQYPQTGIRAFAATLQAERERHHPVSENQLSKTLPLDNEEKIFDEDHSSIWAWEIGKKSYDNYAKIYQSFNDWVLTFNNESVLREVPKLILQETGIALAWRALFEVGTKKLETVGKILWRSAAHKHALNSSDTRQSAIALLKTIYPHLTTAERERIEKEWLKLDFSPFQNPKKARLELLGTLFNNIGEIHLITNEAKILLKNAHENVHNLENRPLFTFQSGWSRDDRHWLEHEGVDISEEQTSALITLSENVKTARDILKENKTQENGSRLWDTLLILNNEIRSNDNIIDLVEKEALHILIEGLGIVLSKDFVPIDRQVQAISRLLELSYHSTPYPSEDTEENFARHMCWGSPAPRIEAAIAIAKLTCKPNLWPQIQERLHSLLLEDPHPAVRFQLAGVLPWIGEIDANAMWDLAENLFKKETNISVIRHALNGLARIADREATRLEPFVIDILTRTAPPDSGDDIVTGLIVFFAINKGLPMSHNVINSWIENFSDQEKRLHSASTDVREKLVLGFSNSNPKEIEIRDKTLSFLWSLLNKLEPTVISFSLSVSEPTKEEKAAIKLLDGIADELYFAAGYNKLVDALEKDDAKRQFLNVYSPLISKLSTLGTPRTVHHLLELLSNFIEVEPKICFDLISEALLRTTGIAKYQYESLGVALFIKLIGIFLADYRFIFAEDATRTKLIDCLALFVDIGWPEARKLFQSLPELLQ